LFLFFYSSDLDELHIRLVVYIKIRPAELLVGAVQKVDPPGRSEPVLGSSEAVVVEA
jgi:hypothetical protein